MRFVDQERDYRGFPIVESIRDDGFYSTEFERVLGKLLNTQDFLYFNRFDKIVVIDKERDVVEGHGYPSCTEIYLKVQSGDNLTGLPLDGRLLDLAYKLGQASITGIPIEKPRLSGP